eukprot:8126296-Alexandrium_andersonii.AAC.1
MGRRAARELSRPMARTAGARRRLRPPGANGQPCGKQGERQGAGWTAPSKVRRRRCWVHIARRGRRTWAGRPAWPRSQQMSSAE